MDGNTNRSRCAIFDFDGTLFDSMFIWNTIASDFIRSLGIEPKPGLDEEVSALSMEQAAVFLQKDYDLNLRADEIIERVNALLERFYVEKVQPKSGVRAFVSALKEAGYRLCIASASPRSHIQAALDRTHMASYFDAVFTCDEIGAGKDEPLIFREAMAHFGADRSSCVVFEDAFHAASTAKADGFRVIGVFDPSEKRQKDLRALCDGFIEDFGSADCVRNSLVQ